MSNADTPPERQNGIDHQLLQKLWTELHEERSGKRFVFRTDDYDFPPARGRTSLDLSKPQVGRSITPGPVDKPVSHDGTWSITGATLSVDMTGWQGTYRIECLTENLLVLVLQQE